MAAFVIQITEGSSLVNKTITPPRPVIGGEETRAASVEEESFGEGRR